MNYLNTIIVLLIFNSANGILNDYVNKISSFFGMNQNENSELMEGFEQEIPYEVSVPDEKFIAEAIKLTGVALAELDSCQHRVVLKLKKSCYQMNDEELAKMAVMLLNCQSSIEGRRIYPCTHEMSIKDCTTNMDADTWNTYHLMSNRARAVCYSVRQTQFIGLTENTVNRLMDATRKQVSTLDKLIDDQENLQNIAQNTLEAVSKGHKTLFAQQEDLRKAQFYGQLSIEDNINRLTDEKRIIAEAHNELTSMTASMQDKLEHATKQLEDQSKESSVNHKELLEDLGMIQQRSQDIFQRIEETSRLLLKQNEEAQRQYEWTLKQLTEVNSTIHSLVGLIGGTRQAMDDQLSWITKALGGTDLALDRLYLLIWHVTFLVVGMIMCAFIGTATSTRIIVATMPPLNLAMGIHKLENSLNPYELAAALCALIVVQTITVYLYKSNNVRQALSWVRNKTTPEEAVPEIKNYPKIYMNGASNTLYESSEYKSSFEDENDMFKEFSVPTPPISRASHYNSRSRSRTPFSINTSSKGSCRAKTRLGTPCKLTSLPGRDFCHRHQQGDSVMG